jgi:membrane protein required for colicin V production
LNWLDLIIVFLITIPTFFGFRKGFLRKVLGIAGIILGFILAVRFYNPIAGFLHGIFSVNELVIQVISFLLIIGVVYGLSVWVSRFMAGMNSGTSLIDKIAGTIFGFLQGLIIASVLLVNLSYIGLPGSETRNNSILYSRVYKVAPAIFDKIISYSPSLAQIYREYKQKYLPEK